MKFPNKAFLPIRMPKSQKTHKYTSPYVAVYPFPHGHNLPSIVIN